MFVKGQREGMGKFYLPGNILIYEGEFFQHMRHGEGSEFREDGSVLFEGEFKNSEFWNGTVYDSLGTEVGTFKEGKLIKNN